MQPVIWIVSPCYNSTDVLPSSIPVFLRKLEELTALGKISERSRVLFVDDGSSDDTWKMILRFQQNENRIAAFIGLVVFIFFCMKNGELSETLLLFTSVWGAAAFILIAVRILAQYVCAAYKESRHRPRYQVECAMIEQQGDAEENV